MTMQHAQTSILLALLLAVLGFAHVRVSHTRPFQPKLTLEQLGQ